MLCGDSDVKASHTKMLGSMNRPITGLVMVMSGPVRALATVIQRHVDNQQSGEAA